jgi:hypothetical protein
MQMADPVFVDCTADTWVLVASNVITGQIWKMLNTPSLYRQTYRMTGGAAPTDSAEGVPVLIGGRDTISATAAIDVYIMAVDADGRVRVDI